MNKITDLGLTLDSVEAIKEYKDLLENLPVNKFKLLQHFFHYIKKYEVGAFGYRTIDKYGLSSVFSTDSNWAKITKDRVFTKNMIQHMNYELFLVKQHNLKIVTRSNLKVHNSFLELLQNSSINSSIVYYLLDKDIIKIFYYIPNILSHEANDLIINNIDLLVNATKKIDIVLSHIADSQEFCSHKVKITSQSILDFIWKGGVKTHLSKKVSINLMGEEVCFTGKEAKCILMLRYGSSNKYIASKLCIATSTLKDRMNNLKRKMKVNSREELVQSIQKLDLNYINELMEIVCHKTN